MPIYLGVKALNDSSSIRVPALSGQTNEQQTITVTGTGNYKLTFNGQTTANIAHNASDAAIKSALEALSNVGVGDVTVVDKVVTFTGQLAGADHNLMTVSDDTTGVDEQQTIALGGASSGDYKLVFDGQTTDAIAHNASDATIESELEALSNIGTGNVDVTSKVVTFQGDLAATNVAQMTVTDNTTNGTPSVSTTRAGVPGVAVAPTTDGTSGTSGETELTTSSVTVVDVENAATRRALGRHSAIGQYTVVATNEFYRDGEGDLVALPSNS
jgi:uncharacterized protein YfaS (alpha-2-macroglobulin family)